MKRSVGLIGFSAFAVAAFAVSGDSVLLSSFAASIHDAKSLKTEYIMQEIGGTRQEYSVALKKPNFARIDSDAQLIVADGKEVTIYDKKAKTFYKEPETGPALSEILSTDALKTWRGFFDDDAYKSISARDLGTTAKGGHDYDAVQTQLDKVGIKTVTYFLDPTDKIARQVEFNTKHGNDASTLLLRTRTLDLNGADKADLYTFAAPDGSQEVSLEDILAGKWYLSLAEAEKVAASSHRTIFIDFMASWCGPCKMLQNEVLDTDQFKSLAAKKKLVLCRIDTDLNPELMTKYGITAIPVQAVVSADGTLISQTVGYGGPGAFYSWLNSATSGSN